MAAANTKKRSRGKSDLITEGCVYVNATFNNTLITVTDRHGNALLQSSAGACGFSGARKGTPHAAQTAMEKVLGEAIDRYKMRDVMVYVCGPGQGRESAIRTVASKANLLGICERTRVPHNGCRPRKKRRI